MRIQFIRNYGNYKIGKTADFEGEELDYILNTKTAIEVIEEKVIEEKVIEESDFESDEIENETLEESKEKKAKKGEK